MSQQHNNKKYLIHGILNQDGNTQPRVQGGHATPQARQHYVFNQSLL